jgi:predicted nucleic acid-binding protein
VIVVDASVLAAVVLREPGWERLAGYLKRAVAPDLVVGEVANVVWKASAVRRHITPEEGEAALKIFLTLLGRNLSLHGSSELVEAAYRLGVREGITIYDALYLALARLKGANLLTLDAEQVKVGQRHGIGVIKA